MLRRSSSISSRRSQLPHATSRTTSQTTHKRSAVRYLASAATASSESEGIYTPFAGSVHEPVHPSIFRPLDDSLFITKPVVLDLYDSRAPGERLSRRRSRMYGEPEIGGNKFELQATYDACLQVGQFSRARALAHRLGELYLPNSPILVAIFNQYLRRVTSDLTLGQRTDVVESVEGWIENDMKKAGVRADSTTYALMIKAALHSLSGSKRDRTVRRYWNIVKELELESEVAGLHNILTDYDLGTISEVSVQNAKDKTRILTV